jgi:SAM-dependent methyltransferase
MGRGRRGQGKEAPHFDPASTIMMTYSEITFNDRNPVKRWLQRRRLVSAVNMVPRSRRTPEAVCDFGAGNGELCKLLADRYPGARLICYEPTPRLLAEARQNLVSVANVEFCPDLRSLTSEAFDLVFCLEVFEHLPPRETTEALQAITALLKPEGAAIIGVPVEVGVPSLYKGIFRMSRRYGSFDANLKNVVRSFLWHPPTNRPISEIAPGTRFHFEHMGFDFRVFRKLLGRHLKVNRVSASPLDVPGSWLMPEIYYRGEKADEAGRQAR